MWEPISLEELQVEIQKTEPKLKDEFMMFWNLVKIEPEKWKHSNYGEKDDSFWVVGIFGKKVIWYNDIEEGFNISGYKMYGIITADDGGGEQDGLNICIIKIFK